MSYKTKGAALPAALFFDNVFRLNPNLEFI